MFHIRGIFLNDTIWKQRGKKQVTQLHKGHLYSQGSDLRSEEINVEVLQLLLL